MSFLPIVERELRLGARKRSVYRIRMLVALLTSGIAILFLLVGRFSGSIRLGGELFSTLLVLAFIYCLIEGLRAADALSEETRAGTLGLLFLTDLHGYDIVLGKFVAAAVRSFHGLLAFLPVLATALILGGVTAGEFWRAALVLLNTLFFSLALALGVSAFSRAAQRALGGTIVLLVAITVGPFVLPHGAGPGLVRAVSSFLRWLSPGSALRTAEDAFYGAAGGEFWGSVAGTHALAWMALAMASRVVRTSWHEPKITWSAKVRGERSPREWSGAGRQAKLEINPVFWLSARHRGDRIWINGLVGAICGVGYVAWFLKMPSGVWLCAMVATLVLLGWIGWRSVQVLGEARQSGALELLLVTPLTTRELIQGQWLATKHLFLWPVVFVLVLRLLGYVVPQPAASAAGSWAFGLFQWAYAGYDLLSFIVSLLAFFWLGLWLGLSRPKLPQAFLLTIVLGLVMPSVVLCIPNLALHLGLLSWARTRLLREFRQVASGERAGQDRSPLAARLFPNPGVPPVIVRRDLR